MTRLRFPDSRTFPKKRKWPRTLGALLLLAMMLAAVWSYDPRENIAAGNAPVRAIDGDSFTIGANELRLEGVDAPEYRQKCKDSMGRDWECGKAARAALEKRLFEPGLTCSAQAKDRYSRALAKCSTARTPDIAAAQVRDGMAVSHEFYGVRDYPDEEDAARAERKGIWIGSFERPEDWRALQRAGSANQAQATFRTNTVPAE
ncbi:MAG: thermonuclease family protein [Sphingomonadales bacterium]|nr:thermonuclease family protein [Sphingomonadales bacterium]MBK9268176.1 thermonuclease family protein [Sphingomonadales bacterium]MBP6434273.1 thermonuclease family protein [Sphingorhabdus sp.]